MLLGAGAVGTTGLDANNVDDEFVEEIDALNDETFGGGDDEWDPDEIYEEAEANNNSEPLLDNQRRTTTTAGAALDDRFARLALHASDLESEPFDDPAIMTAKRLPGRPSPPLLPPMQLPSASTVAVRHSPVASLTSSLLTGLDPFSSSSTAAPTTSLASFPVSSTLLGSSVWAPAPTDAISTLKPPTSNPWALTQEEETKLRLPERREPPPSAIPKPIRLEDLEATLTREQDTKLTLVEQPQPSAIGKPIRLEDLEASLAQEQAAKPLPGQREPQLSAVSKPVRLEELEAKLLQQPELPPPPSQIAPPSQPVPPPVAKPSLPSRASPVPPADLHAPPPMQQQLRGLQPPLRPAVINPLLLQQQILQQQIQRQTFPMRNPNFVPRQRIPFPPMQPHLLALQPSMFRPVVNPLLMQQQLQHLQQFQRNPNFVQRQRTPFSPHQSFDTPPHHRQQGDEYAGLMTLREREWLLKIQYLQLEGLISDPYKEDYYNVALNSKKLMRGKDNNSPAGNAPTLVVPERSIRRTGDGEDDNARPRQRLQYEPLQFANSLGKLQASKLDRPRRLLDLTMLNEKNACTESIPSTPSRAELAKLRKLLMDIERLYLVLLEIDYEDKRMAALPESARGEHRRKRSQLCKKLFDGLLAENGQLNDLIGSIRKGRSLIFRSLTLLDDARQKAFLISQVIDRKLHTRQTPEEKTLYGIDYGKLLRDAIDAVNKVLPVAEKVSLLPVAASAALLAT